MPRLIHPTACVLVATLMLAVGCFPKRPGPRLAHFADAAPSPGMPAPGFRLPGVDGREVSLASLLGERPLVLVLGSESCPVFRHRRHWLRALAAQFEGRVNFLAVYVTEAHPVGAPSPFTGEEWDLWVNRVSGVRVRQARSFDERFAQARRARDSLGLAVPLAVDRMDDAVWAAYGAASAPAFVIDRQGRVVARQVWSDPGALRRVLNALVD